MTQPTGVFVRLPLDEAQIMKLYNPKKSGNENLLAIGTPVTGGSLIPIGEVAGHFSDGQPMVRILNHPNLPYKTKIALYSEAQAAIAALEAEVGRLREYYEASEAINKVGILEATPEMYDRESRARKALKGPEE